MRFLSLTVMFTLAGIVLYAQKPVSPKRNQASPADANSENVYTIKKQFQEHVLHNPAEEDNDDDNDLARFNRWFHMAEVRCYPSGNLPRPDVLLRAHQAANAAASKKAHKTTTGVSWQPVGPAKVPTNFNGIGRINVIVIDPLDTNKLYIGAACGGVWISHDGGTTWATNSDNFPSVSVADIAVNPIHTDTIYAATGDGYGYENGSYNIFWGGLYSAGVMKSTDGGATWDTTGLSYIQSNREIVQKLLIHPRKPNILLAATRHGIFRTTDAGATWASVDVGHVYSMAFHPYAEDTIYAMNGFDLKISYDAGATWTVKHAGITTVNDRTSLAVSPSAPEALWLLDPSENLQWSPDNGVTLLPMTSPNSIANFYGYYDRVLAVSPADLNNIYAFGMDMAKSTDAGLTWSKLNPPGNVHVDNHAIAINPLHPATIYCGNDGGISVTRNGGNTWKNLGNGLMISEIYRIGTSQQSPNIMVCGLQDNGTFSYNGTNWLEVTGGDGMDCAIHPTNDQLQISSYQNGNFFMSYDQGLTFTGMTVSPTETGSWTSPVVFDPNNEMNIYVGLQNIYVSLDQGLSFLPLTTTAPFSTSGGATCLAIAPSNSSVLYAADNSRLMRTINGGTTWSVVTGSLAVGAGAITHVAVDPRDAMRIYVTLSGYTAGKKLYLSTTGGGSGWINLTADLPNVPADCIAVDTSTPGALFVGTDLGVYYTDSSTTGWTLYNTGLPNVIVDDLDINYGNYKIRAATYGRGVWECRLKKDAPNGIAPVGASTAPKVTVYPNPTTTSWKLLFPKQKPASYTVKVTDALGRTVQTLDSPESIDAAKLATGVYALDVTVGNAHYSIKGLKK